MAAPQLERTLTWVHGTALAIGTVLGSGVLILPAITAEQAGPASILAWVLMSLLAFPLALTLGRLGAKHPHAGGIVEYVRLAFGEMAGRVTAWLFLGTVPIGAPIVALVGADYFIGIFGFPQWLVPVLAAVMLFTSLALHVRGVKMAAWVQVFILLLIAGLMIAAILAAGPHVRVSNFQPLAPHGWFPVGTVAVEIFWCYVGWEMVGHLAEEFRQPARDLRLTFTIAPAVVGFLYVALSVVTVGSHAYGTALGMAPLSHLVGIGLGKTGFVITGIVALLITLGAIHGNVAGYSRMVYSQARAGVFPVFLGRLHRRFLTPVGALAALAVDFALVLIVYTAFHVDLGTFVKWPSVVFLVLYGIAMAASVKLLKNEGWGTRSTAIVPLVVSAGLYPLSGWAVVFPLLLGLVGWMISRRQTVYQPTDSNGLIQ